MRIMCFGCGKSVSSVVPPDTILRAVAWCPECLERIDRELLDKVLNQMQSGGQKNAREPVGR